MLQESLMETLWQPMPYLVLSTAVTLRGQVEKHLFTPFGYVDIRFPAAAGQRRKEGRCCEVTVAGDFDPRRFDDAGLIEFKDYLLNLIRSIAQHSLGEMAGGTGGFQVKLVPGEPEPAHAPVVATARQGAENQP